MFAFKWFAVSLSLSSFLLAGAVQSDGIVLSNKGGMTIPLVRRGLAKRDFKEGDVVGGSVGLGDAFDTFYSAVVEVGNSTVTLALDMTYGDITVISSNCTIGSSVVWSVVEDSLGDELQADVRWGRDTVTLAGLTMANQSILVIDNYTSPSGSLPFGDEAGRLGLGFPFGYGGNLAGAGVLGSVLGDDSSNLTYWVEELPKVGGIIHRLILAGAIEQPLFVVTLQRDTIDVSGTGQLTIGQLPEGINESNITWVPIRLITPEEGGWAPNAFAPDELYPRSWEIELDAVFVDGKNVTALSGNSTTLSAGIDVRYPYLDVPSSASDAINNVLGTHVGVFWDCAHAHNLTFQIGGKLFPLDPRDFYSNDGRNATECTSSVQDRRLSSSSSGRERSAPYNWTLGVPFLKSNAVVFYFGNLTHPSADPPKIGLVSLVPEDAGALLQGAVGEAESASTNLAATNQPAPTNGRAITKGEPSSSSIASTTGPGSRATATGASNAVGLAYPPCQAFVQIGIVILLVLRAFAL